ncbi:MAG: 16S rRNA (uracil(1498)-N(3))-methyltransferase [Alphaproteobacteria bacterium]|nr:16S rRNA (uracil(1498)-N(3))-methyltransferase [Alphaproteobacteria bacterium]MCS5597160.1 16S rRNA (uracil(1498)-N(3))-methyltransferase [Alphaproteobacteria bacterium]|tara:strand:+ start:7756 stop:8472 length:717 start_codon:yes stop_codon:yes gene_type:complete
MNEQNVHKKLPRLYINAPLNADAEIPFEKAQAHYLHNVLRQNIGDKLRVFNGRDGEWLCRIDDINKKSGSARAEECLHPQPSKPIGITLLCAPIKKHRMDFMIEKAVELGANGIHPVLTQNTEIRKINEERINQQIIEATEQCERLDLPQLKPLAPLNKALGAYTHIYAAIERAKDIPHIGEIPPTDGAALLIGPEGGFTAEECDILRSSQNVIPVSLGQQILRAETAALYGLSFLNR